MLIKLLAVSLAAVSAGRALAAEPKEELVAAVKKLAEAPNYSWSTKVEGGFSAGAGEGRTQKDGTSRLRVALGDDTYDVVIRDGKGAAKGAGGWASAAELNRDADEDSANFGQIRRGQERRLDYQANEGSGRLLVSPGAAGIERLGAGQGSKTD